MTCIAGRWQAKGCVVRICRSVVIWRVAAGAGIRGVGVIALMAGSTIVCNGCMGAGKRIYSGMVEIRWCPCCLRMTGFAGVGEVRSQMVRICRLIILIRMATKALVRTVCVISLMAGGTIIGNWQVGAGNDVITVVDRKSCRFPSCQGGMTGGAVGRDIF